MTTRGADRATYVPAGRPVARFVLVLVVLAGLFGGVWWSGLAAPRLGLATGSQGSYDAVSGRTTATVELRNNSPATAELRGVILGDGRLTVDSVSVDGRDLAHAGHPLGGGETATLVITFMCRPGEGGRTSGPGPAPMTRLHVTVRTPIGLERTTTAGNVMLFPACVR